MPKNCFYRIRCGDDKAFDEAFYRCAYLAKVRGKDYGSLGTNNNSVSLIRLKTHVSVRAHGKVVFILEHKCIVLGSYNKPAGDVIADEENHHHPRHQRKYGHSHD